MVALTLSIAQREQFDEIANRDMDAEALRNTLPEMRWFGPGTQIFIVPMGFARQFISKLI